MGSQNILNDVSMDVSDLSNDVPRMISSIEENDTQNLHSPKPCVCCQIKMIIEQFKMFLMMTAMSLMFVNQHLGTKALNKYLCTKATKSATRFHTAHL
jgi:hypothetical protein